MGMARAAWGRERALIRRGQELFNEATFAGNGRTCVTCHGLTTGTLSPEEVQDRFLRASQNAEGVPSDPLFRALDSDERQDESYQRLLEQATIRVAIDLPPHLRLESDPAATRVIVPRGIPSVLNIGLEGVLMQDGRAPDLPTQALGAVLGHAEAPRAPAFHQLAAIAEFEKTLYTRLELEAFARGGPAPGLPEGRTPEEIRGRRHFQPGGQCHLCHAGPMLNETSSLHPAGAGQRFENIFISGRNRLDNPLHTFLFVDANGETRGVTTPDPGLALVSQQPVVGLFVRGPVNFFRIPTLWNVKNTAPYFHDNSSRTLEEVMDHYRLYLTLSAQDAQDIIAFLRLL